MKTDKNYKMPHAVKSVLAAIVDPVEKQQYKRAMIEAHLFEVATRPKSKKNKNESDEG